MLFKNNKRVMVKEDDMTAKNIIMICQTLRVLITPNYIDVVFNCNKS